MFFTICTLLAMLLPYGLPDVKNAETIATETVKCGRDSVYLAISQLGEEVRLSEIDRMFGGVNQVSMQQVSEVLTRLGLRSKGFRFEGKNIRMLAGRFRSQTGTFAAILHFTDAKRPNGHFAVLTRIDEDSLEVTDGTDLITIPIDANTNLSVLLLSKSQFPLTFSGMRLFYDDVMLLLSNGAILASISFLSVGVIAFRYGYIAFHRLAIVKPPAFRHVFYLSLITGFVATPVFFMLSLRQSGEEMVRVNKRNIDFGVNDIGSTVQDTVIIANPTTEIKNVKLRASCSCIVLSDSSLSLKPLESQIVEVSSQVQNVGLLEYEIRVEDGKNSVPISLQMKGKEGPAVVPRRKNLGFVPGDAHWTRETRFKISRLPKGTSPTSVSVGQRNPCLLEASLVPDSVREGEFLVKISQPKSLGIRGVYETEVVISTSDGKNHFASVLTDFISAVHPHNSTVFVEAAEDGGFHGDMFIDSPFGNCQIKTVRSAKDETIDLASNVEVIETTTTGIRLGFAIDSIATEIEMQVSIDGTSYPVRVQFALSQ
jgi:hypothetical protein